ncbi:MAG: hypothetical protein ACRDTC_16065 [Pseudonocardiaceae bacterium]
MARSGSRSLWPRLRRLVTPGEPGWCYWLDEAQAHTYLRQNQPEVDQAVALASQAVQTLSGEANSARCVGHLARFVGEFAPYRRRPAVRQLTEQAAGLLTSH